MSARMTIFAASALAFTVSPALAQTFTYSSVDSTTTAVGGPDFRGNVMMGTHTTGTSTVTWADGKKTTDKYTCIGTTQPSNDKIFDVHTVCDAGNADGTYTAVFGCQFLTKDGKATGCVGGLTGRTGKYAGMGGAITFSGAGGSGTGTGSWAKAGE